MMELKAFRIKNFRSISDTGWQNLSPDNITCLIGQNESGKTSILEAMKVFYSGIISEDVLRSDLSLPEVSCRFSIPKGWLLSITDNPGTELKELLSGLTQVELTRKWIADLSSVKNVSGEISQYLSSLEDAWKLYLDDVSAKLDEELKDIREMETTQSKLAEEESSLRSKLATCEPRSKGFRLFGKKAGDLAKSESSQYSGLKNQLNVVKKRQGEIVESLRMKQLVKRIGEKWESLLEICARLDDHLNELSIKLEDRHQKMTLLMRPIDDDVDIEWNEVLKDYRKTRSEKDLRMAEIERQIALSGYMIEGSSEEEAENKVDEIIQSYKSQYNSDILGNKYFEYCPVFELFEDFGSLLPNRIDMEDIVSGNEQVEGYKAARNFLSLAQVDYSFFQQPSSRILKQKIENLNHTLTHNFQDFWQQSIGRNNKIHIQFELDHYNASYGDKAGKPYLEFWIKDEGERLYPKQRSRGVRWFLSFYMELKASAKINTRQMVLLVDEPGVSLHARAQEDVLKVFEDIKDKIHVIYTTHSPHLVEINKLHRVLAVQRDDLDSLRSTTRVLDPLSLSSASRDTLTPLQNILGNPMTTEGFSTKWINIIVNDTGSFYILKAIILLMEFKGEVCVIPSTNVSSIPLLCNIMMGWGVDFAVLLFENDEETQLTELLKKTVFKTDNVGKELIVRMKESFLNSEDLLSTLDFKNHILESREGITVPNSIYIRENELPRNFILSRFLANVKAGKVKASDFDEETLENFRLITDLLKDLK
ncbi:MAG TPA: AAA family ATPase [Bacteroidales bacterium]|nr:AAA family ATPase [Bacteroidales bacterium]